MNQFEKDVHQGLSSEPKKLSSKYFYDERGDQLFVKIMEMPEYYLTNCEFEILSEQTATIVESFDMTGSFELIELGAGNGKKTFEILKELTGKKEFIYKPVDISPNALEGLQNMLNTKLPTLRVEPICGEYFQALQKVNETSVPKVILFLGSNIGNMLDVAAKGFMHKLSGCLNKGDKVLMGVDLIKDESIVLPAYNDAQGYTREFNLNLLHRINRELDANIQVDQFIHRPLYSKETGLAESYLESKCDQQVEIGGRTYHFKAGERIHTEISRKYNDQLIREIIEDTKLVVDRKFTDTKEYFADYLLKMT